MNHLKSYFRIRDLYKNTKYLEMYKTINYQNQLKEYNTLHDKTSKIQLLNNFKKIK
jgi:hypothetical protein